MARRSDDDESIRSENIAKANKGGPIPKKASLGIYVVVLLLALAARTFQLYTNMDFTTNRYIDPSPAKNYPLMVIVPGLFIIALVLIIGNARDKVAQSCILINPWRLRYDRLNEKIPGAAGYSAILMAMLVLAQIIFDIGSIVHRNTELMKAMTFSEAKHYSKLTGYTVGMLVNHFIMLLVVLTFISIASNIFKGSGISSANCAALSIYCGWKTYDIFCQILGGSAFILNSESAYEVLSGMTAVLFFLSIARFFNGMERRTTRFFMCFWGYTSSLLAAVSVIPRYIMLLIPTDIDKRLDMNLPKIADMGIVFVTITLVAVFWTTYAYRQMPRQSTGNRHWSKGAILNDYQPMDDIDEDARPDDSNRPLDEMEDLDQPIVSNQPKRPERLNRLDDDDMND